MDSEYKDEPIESIEEYDDIPPLDYARLHGLCIDYTSVPLPVDELPTPTEVEAEADLKFPINDGFEECKRLLASERLTITRDAALYLKDLSSLIEAPESLLDIDRLLAEENGPRCARSLKAMKLEHPLLSTDTELDLLEFGCTDVPNIQDSNIPEENVDDEKDEGLQWPSSYEQYPLQWRKRTEGEKIVVKKDVVLWLQETLKDQWKPDDSKKAVGEDLTERKVRHITTTRLICWLTSSREKP